MDFASPAAPEMPPNLIPRADISLSLPTGSFAERDATPQCGGFHRSTRPLDANRLRSGAATRPAANASPGSAHRAPPQSQALKWDLSDRVLTRRLRGSPPAARIRG